MMYMPDCIKATIDLMEADLSRLTRHADYNLAAFSFSPQELVSEIEKYIPGLSCLYEPDFRQQIADSWPRTIDDSAARRDWGWEPEYDLGAMVADMVEKLSKKHAERKL
jgi:nucleoside-diphosphate-sugar epimerase